MKHYEYKMKKGDGEGYIESSVKFIWNTQAKLSLLREISFKDARMATQGRKCSKIVKKECSYDKESPMGKRVHESLGYVHFHKRTYSKSDR